MKSYAKALDKLSGEGAFAVLTKARKLEAEGKEVLHFEIGEPDFPTPQPVIQEVKKALDEDFTHYVPSDGIPELKDAIAKDIDRSRGFLPQSDQILVLPGGKPVIFFTMTGLLEPGDEVIYPDPGFPTYGSLVDYTAAVKVPIPLLEENEFRMNPGHIQDKITKNTKLIIINSPENPTGSVINPDEIKEIAKLAQEYDSYILTDEIYSKMLYDGAEFASPSSFDKAQERTIILDGMSKSYSMTGWRLGYAVGPPKIIEMLKLLALNAISCTTAFVQRAGVEALEGDQSFVTEMMDQFTQRRRAIVDGLNSIDGITCVLPKGAFYAWPNITGTGKTSKELADHFLYKAGVAALPGTSFGQHGEGYLRFSYPTSVENIEKAIERMKAVL